MSDFFEEYGPSFLGLQLLRLYTAIDQGGTEAIKSTGLPARVASLLVFLKHHGPSSISDLAKAVSASHQLVSQRIEILHQDAHIGKVPDPDDHRRMLIKLTAKGRKAAEAVEDACAAGDAAYRQLFKEIGADVFASVVTACHALEERSLELRIRDVVEKNAKAAKK